MINALNISNPTTAVDAAQAGDTLPRTASSPSASVPDSVLDVPPVIQSVGDPVVNAALEDISTYNKLLWMQAHSAWDNVAAQFGTAIAEKAKAADDAGIAAFGMTVMAEATTAGVPVSIANDGTRMLNVATSSFSSGEKTYAVGTNDDGSLTATANGKAWKTWDAPSSGVLVDGTTAGAIALQLLKAKPAFSTLA